MKTQPENIKHNSKILLDSVKRILDHQEELIKLKGENFNVFSILKMESKENETHSAFLGELLNPLGSHGKGDVFLKLFLNEIGASPINIDSSSLVLEQFIGKRNDKQKEGGRVDIYINDNTGNSICIENKIYAVDQNVQIERYVNHNKKTNQVFYLTLYGEDASKESKGSLEEGKDYCCISYQQHIVDWLESCFKEAAEQPILRETIKQYSILIKKLTNQLSNSKMEKEIEALIIKNYREAKTIADNIKNVELIEVTNFINELKEYIEQQLIGKWRVVVDKDLSKSWTGLDIIHSSWDEGIAVGLQGQSKIPYNESIIGIKAFREVWNREVINNELISVEELKSNYKETAHWVRYQSALQFHLTNEIEKIFAQKTRNQIKKEVGDRMVSIAKLCELPLSKAVKL